MLTRTFEHPDDNSQLSEFSKWVKYVDVNWSYYIGSAFDRVEQLSAEIEKYTDAYDLYSNTKLLINPSRQLVDFYVDNLYPGTLSYDGEKLTNGQVNAIPFSDKTPQELKAAIGQIWDWSNFLAQLSIIVRHGASIGSSFVEIIDDLNHGKVTFNPIWPAFIKDLELDTSGNVKKYTITYKDKDTDGKPYVYKKIVDGTSIAYFKDDKPFDYFDNGATEWVHGYGFCPAVWIKHIDFGGREGIPASSGSIPKIDEICSLLTHIADTLHKLLESPMIFWAEGPIKDAIGQTNPQNANGVATDDYGNLGQKTKRKQKSTLILKGPPSGRVDTLAPTLNLQTFFTMIEVLNNQIAKEHPELTYYDDLRKMSQTTGPAVINLVGDVATKVSSAASQYDRQLVKLFQMGVAIAGEHANNKDGAWAEPTKKQQKFLKFSLASYDNDELGFNIEPRPLLKATPTDKANERVAYWGGVEAQVAAGDDIEDVLMDDGWSAERIAKIVANKNANKVLALSIQSNANPKPDLTTGGSDTQITQPETIQQLNN